MTAPQGGRPAPITTAELVELFAMEELYGGHVAAQALLAATRTVDDGRLPHSLHGYFLRPGQVDRPTIFQVNRDRDGRSFSARHVVAMQDGAVILSLSVSFQVPEDGVEHEARHISGIPGPDGLAAPQPGGTLGEWTEAFDFRLPVPEHPTGPDGSWSIPTQMWCRTAAPVVPDPYLHAAILTYVSDLSTGFGTAGLPIEPAAGGPSLDHAMWFHRPVDPSEWFLLDLEPLLSAGGRGLYLGGIYDPDLRRCASITQEVLTRRPRHR
jgi:acyl-CoA thioesterase-2